jgi:hypothetical protein
MMRLPIRDGPYDMRSGIWPAIAILLGALAIQATATLSTIVSN